MYTDLLQTEHTTVHKPFKTFSLNSHNIPNSYYGCYQRWPPPQCITLQLFIPSVVPSLRVMTQLILCLAFDYKHISSSDAALLLKLAHKKTHRVYLSLLGLALGEASSCAVHLAWDQHAWGRPHGEREMPALRPVVPVTPAHVTEDVFSRSSPCHHQTRVPT